MLPNRRKSGVMYLDWKRNSKGPEEKELFGYPVVRNYKYLGGWLDDKLKLSVHLGHVERKLSFVMHKLTPIRLLKDMRLNINLFRTMCMPMYRMGLLNSLCTTKTDQNEYYKAIRKRFKAFCYLPKCLPNKVVEMILGKIEGVANGMANLATNHLAADGLVSGRRQTLETAGTKYYRDVPSMLYRVFDLMYRSACV